MIKKFIHKLHWTWNDVFKVMIGMLISCASINLFIVPNGIYNGGVLGFSQLVRSIINNVFHLKAKFDYSGLLYYVLNIPIFILAYKKISKTFLARTLFAVSLQTLLLSVIPVYEVLDDTITSILIGAILGGIGTGMILSCGSSTGGTDIIGLIAAKKSSNFSVGKLATAINLVIYIIAGIIFGVPIMIYSIVFTAVFNLMLDKMHEQNICSTAFIFCKKNPKKLNEYIKNELGRDFTYWDAKGGYDDTRTYIIYTALTKYELIKLEHEIKKKEYDDHIFIVKSDGVSIKGEFDKRFQ